MSDFSSFFSFGHILVGVLILIVGTGFHWVGQLFSVFNWKKAEKIGLQSKNMPKEARHYEHGIAVADALLGWIYTIAGIGVILNEPWGYTLSVFPAVVFVYHSLCFLFWTRNQRKAGLIMMPFSFCVFWFVLNFGTGALTFLLIWGK